MILRGGLALFALALGPRASADDLAGVWRFTTAPTAYNCTISGEMTILPSNSLKHDCTFTAVQTCTERLPSEMHTQQSCVAVQVGKLVSIKSKLDQLTSVAPLSMSAGAEYAPDDFSLKLSGSGDEMLGNYSSHRTSPAKFWRKRQLVS